MKRKVRVVYNACFGNFELSDAAKARLLELKVSNIEELPRHDQRLVQVVEELGFNAGTEDCKPKVTTLHSHRYYIEELDGLEFVKENSLDQQNWIIVE